MKSLSDFTKKSQVAEANITRDKFYKNEVYKKGEWVLTEQGQVGKIHRRGPNYVLCLTAENTKFRSWITDIKEVFEGLNNGDTRKLMEEIKSNMP